MVRSGFIAAWLLVVLLMPPFARGEDGAVMVTAREDPSRAIVGVWSNDAEGFSRLGIEIFESGGGFLLGAVSAVYFRWHATGLGRFELEIFAKDPPETTFVYDEKKRTITMVGMPDRTGHLEVFKKTSDAIRKDPILEALAKEKEESEERRRKAEKRFDIRTLDHLGQAEVLELHRREAEKGGAFFMIFMVDGSSQKRFLSISRSEERYHLSLHFEEAVDESWPEEVTMVSPFDEKPETDLPIRSYLSAERVGEIKSLLQARSLDYRPLPKRIDYFEGYRTGYDDLATASMERKDFEEIFPVLVAAILEEQGTVDVEILRERLP